MKITIRNFAGSALRELEIAEHVFGCTPNPLVVKENILWQLAKRRSGCHKTKQIGDISGTTKKPFPQKGRGAARQGSLRSPQFRGGAVVFGPVVRDHGYKLNKKVRSLGLRMGLTDKLNKEQLVFVDHVPVDIFKTRDAAAALRSVCGSCRKVVIYVDQSHYKSDLYRAFRNIENVDLISADGINMYDLLVHDGVIITESALNTVMKRFQ